VIKEPHIAFKGGEKTFIRNEYKLRRWKSRRHEILK